MAKAYGWLAQAFLILALVGWIGWVVTKFRGPIMKVGQDGFFLLLMSSVGIVIALSLFSLAAGKRPE